MSTVTVPLAAPLRPDAREVGLAVINRVMPLTTPGGIWPWDPIDAADTELGWQYRFVTPRRAYEIRREIEHGDR